MVPDSARFRSSDARLRLSPDPRFRRRAGSERGAHRRADCAALVVVRSGDDSRVMEVPMLTLKTFLLALFLLLASKAVAAEQYVCVFRYPKLQSLEGEVVRI